MSGYGMWKLWTNDEDVFVARSAADAVVMAEDLYGPCDETPDDYYAVPPTEMVKVFNEGLSGPFREHTAVEWARESVPGLLCSKNI